MGSWATKSTGDTLTATEFNLVANEIENQETAGTETPAAGTSDQLAKSIVNCVGNADFYTGGGAADVYTATVIAPNKSPTSLRVGMKVRFRPSANNTGASTIDVATLGVENIKLQNGSSNPAAGDISTARDTELRWDGANFRIISQFNDATTTVKGIGETATPAEAEAKSATDKFLTPAAIANIANKVLLETQVASNDATIDFTSNIDGTYKNYLVEFTNVRPATDAVIFQMHVSENGGGAWKIGASDYQYSNFGRNTAVDNSYVSTGDTSMALSDDSVGSKLGNGANESYSGEMVVYNPSGTALQKLVRGSTVYVTDDTADLQMQTIAGSYKGTTNAINALRFFMSSGNMYGTLKLYGLR